LKLSSGETTTHLRLKGRIVLGKNIEFEIQFLYAQLLGNPQNNLESKVCNCNKSEMLLSPILFITLHTVARLPFFQIKKSAIFLKVYQDDFSVIFFLH